MYLVIIKNIKIYKMVLNELQVKEDLASYKTQFKNIKNRLIQHYPSFVNTPQKKDFERAQAALNALYNNMTLKETQINAQIGTVGNLIKNYSTNIGVAKTKYISDLKNLNTSSRVNAASDELKIDKYNENIEEYLNTFFYLFGIILMFRFVRL
jgi:hypothetical protein